MIRKRKGKYVVLSHDGKRSFGTYDTEAQAKKRLAQVHYFKYLHEDKGQVNGMDITKVLSYLKEELKDIPANPDNIHYTDFEGLYYILQSGLKGQLGGYNIHSPKTKKNDMELSTVRGSHKLSDKEKRALSSGAEGGVRIDLFTNRILAAHRGTRKDKIAELPLQRKELLKKDAEDFKKRFGYEIPDLTKGIDHIYRSGDNMSTVKGWLKENGHGESWPAIREIHFYNQSIQHYYDELKKREREERFILKKNIPVDPKFMSIVIEKHPDDIDAFDDEFCDEVAENYLKLLKAHENVIVQNGNLRLFKGYLRDKLNGSKKKLIDDIDNWLNKNLKNGDK